MNTFFINTEYQNFFNENGYIIVKLDSINDFVIQKLKSINQLYNHSSIKIETNRGFYLGMDHPDKKLVKEILTSIDNLVFPLLKPIINNFIPFISNFIIKEPDKEGVILPHQDWTFIEDEVNNIAITCWIPLDDVDTNNGCMGVIKKSHTFFKSVRASPPVPFKSSPLSGYDEVVFPYFEWLPMKAGEILFFDYRIIHASLPNCSTLDRVAVGMWFAKDNASFCHYYFKPGPEKKLLKYKVNRDFFIKYDNKTLSALYADNKIIEDYEIVDEIKFIHESTTKQELIQKIEDAGNIFQKKYTQKKSNFKTRIIDRFKSIFM